MFISIPQLNCPDDRVTDHNLCSRWDLEKNKKYTSKISSLATENKFFLVKVEPSIKPQTIEGDGNFDLGLNFDYSYKLKDGEVKYADFFGSKEVTVSCNSKTNLCEEFILIYNANIFRKGDFLITIETRLDNWNKNIINGFNLKVRFVF